jgi:hypothetical protein
MIVKTIGQFPTRSLTEASPDEWGGLNASMQDWLKVHVQKSTKLNSIKGVNLNGPLPCLGSD